MMEWRVGRLLQLGATNRHRGKRPPTSCGSSPQAEGNISSRMRTAQRLWHRTPKSPRCDLKQCIFAQKAFQSIHCSFSAHICSRSHARAPCQLSFAGGTGSVQFANTTLMSAGRACAGISVTWTLAVFCITAGMLFGSHAATMEDEFEEELKSTDSHGQCIATRLHHAPWRDGPPQGQTPPSPPERLRFW